MRSFLNYSECNEMHENEIIILLQLAESKENLLKLGK